MHPQTDPTDLPALGLPPAEEAPARTRSIVVRVSSEAALERALALAAEENWVAALAVDRSTRTLRLTLRAGSSRAGRVEKRILH